MLPWELDPSVRWYSVSEYAARLRRTPRCIRRWCEDGTILRHGCLVYFDSSKRWWIGQRPSSHLYTGNMGTIGANY